MFKEIHHLVEIRIGINEIAQGDEYLGFPGKTLDRMAKLWNAIVIVKLRHWKSSRFVWFQRKRNSYIRTLNARVNERLNARKMN